LLNVLIYILLQVDTRFISLIEEVLDVSLLESQPHYGVSEGWITKSMILGY